MYSTGKLVRYCKLFKRLNVLKSGRVAVGMLMGTRKAGCRPHLLTFQVGPAW